MTRRTLLSSSAAASLAGDAAAATEKKALFELMRFNLRNGPENQRERAVEFLKAFVPAAKRAGAGPIGVFSSAVGEDSPYLLLVTSFPGFAEIPGIEAKLGADADLRKAQDTWYAGGRPYERVENSLLRAFDTMPAIEAPSVEGRKGGRLFELRTYESANFETLGRKIRMFDEGEIAIFRKVGLVPVFFGSTLFGRNMPNLTYMLAHDDAAARERNWRAFGSHPEWLKLRAQPGLADAEIVSNISVSLLSPLPFSDIR
jgi:hypothetical protein